MAAGALGLLIACSGITDNKDGISSLEITYPANTFLELGASVTVKAVALNSAGDPVDAPIRWFTPDTTVTLDSLTGQVTALYSTGTARVQAGVLGKDTLITQQGGLTFTLTPKADTLVLVGEDSVDVLQDNASTQIEVTLLGGTPLVGVFGRPISFRIIEPAPADSPAVVFASGRASDSLTSSGTGSAIATIRAAQRQTPPDRVVVAISAYRASGEPIAGSGQEVVLRFRHQ